MSLGSPSQPNTGMSNQSGWQTTSGNSTTGAGGNPSWALSSLNPMMWGNSANTSTTNQTWPQGWGGGGVAQPAQPTASTAGTGSNWSTQPGPAPTGWTQTATPTAPSPTGFAGTAPTTGTTGVTDTTSTGVVAGSYTPQGTTAWSPPGTAPGPNVAPLAPAPLSTDPWIGGMPSGGFGGTSMPTVLDTNSPNYRPGGPGTPTQGQMVPLNYQFNPPNPAPTNTLLFDPSVYGFPQGATYAPGGTSNTGYMTNFPKMANSLNQLATRHPGLAQELYGGTSGINSLMQSLFAPNWTETKQLAQHAAEANAPPREPHATINGVTYTASNPPPAGTIWPGMYTSPGVPFVFPGGTGTPATTPTTPAATPPAPVVPGINTGSGNGGNFF